MVQRPDASYSEQCAPQPVLDASVKRITEGVHLVKDIPCTGVSLTYHHFKRSWKCGCKGILLFRESVKWLNR